MTLKEYIIILKLWGLFFIIYSLFLWDFFNIHSLLIISFVLTSFVKSIYDIKYRTGYQKIYIYSKETNQKLRYLTLCIATLVTILYHYVLFCRILDYCAK